jgi:hypothetical protein
MPLSNFFQPFAFPIPCSFSGCSLSAPPKGSNPMCAFLLNFVVCTVYGQSSVTVFPVFVVQFIVYFYTESCLTELFAVVESVTDGDAVPSPAGILPSQDQRSNLPVVRKKERDYMGMFEYRKEDEHIIVKHLIHGMLFVCLFVCVSVVQKH